MPRVMAHGLCFASNFPVLAAEAGPGEQTEIFLQQCSGKAAPDPADDQWIMKGSGHLDVAFFESGNHVLLRSYCGSQAWFSLDDSAPRRLFISRAPSISSARFQHTALHAFVPHALACWGHDILHATTVVVDGRALLLSGPSGSGKSTLAAGFLQRGDIVLSEDIVRVSRRAQGYEAFASYPGVRLRTGSFLLSSEGRAGRRGTFGLPKHRVMTNVSPASDAVPVLGMFFLARSRSPYPTLDRLAGGTLLDEWLGATFLGALPKRRFAREAFAIGTRLARDIPAYRLSYKRSPQHFRDLLDEIVNVARSLNS